MTCIIGYVDTKGNGHMVGDSAGTNVTYHSRIDLHSAKIFEKCGMLIGYTTSFRMGQILEHCLEFPDRTAGLTDFEYLIRQLVPAIRKVFVEEKYIQDTDKQGGNFIIVWKGAVYEIQGDFSVFNHSRGFASCGSGNSHAQGFIEACRSYGIMSDDAVEDVLRNAIMAISNHNITVSGRVDYLYHPLPVENNCL